MSTKITLSSESSEAILGVIIFAQEAIDKQNELAKKLNVPLNDLLFQKESAELGRAIEVMKASTSDVYVLKEISDATYWLIVRSAEQYITEVKNLLDSLAKNESTKDVYAFFPATEHLWNHLETFRKNYSEFKYMSLKYGLN